MLKCSQHPKNRAIYAPLTNCDICWFNFVVKKLEKHTQLNDKVKHQLMCSLVGHRLTVKRVTQKDCDQRHWLNTVGFLNNETDRRKKL